MVPLALAVMAFTRRSSMATQPSRAPAAVVTFGPAELAGLAALQAKQAPLLPLGLAPRWV
jgi:hypothetical protein